MRHVILSYVDARFANTLVMHRCFMMPCYKPRLAAMLCYAHRFASPQPILPWESLCMDPMLVQGAPTHQQIYARLLQGTVPEAYTFAKL